MTEALPVAGVDDLREALDREGYLADDALATALYLALRLRQPVLLEGEAGVGKTHAARALAALQDDAQIDTTHIDAIAELALYHRRRATPELHRQSPNNSHQHNSQNSSANESSEADGWGEMPPQPVDAATVKGVKPLPLKKR